MHDYYYPVLQNLILEHKVKARFRNEKFLKKAFKENTAFLIKLCEEQSNDTIHSITFHGATQLTFSRDNKELGLDFYIEDDKGRCYNIELQNYYLSLNERVRFNTYGDRIVQNQVRRSQSYDKIPQCYQMIYYFGDPISTFKVFEDTYRKTVGSTGAPYDGSKLISTIYTVKHLDKLIEEMYNKGELHLTFTEQFCYLLLNDVPYPYMEPDNLIKEMIPMLRAFNEEDEARWKLYDEEDQIKIDNTELEEAKIEARKQGLEQGLEQGLVQAERNKDIEYLKSQAELLRRMIKSQFTYVSPYVEKHIVKASFEALCNAIIAISSINNPDDLIPILQS